MAKKGKKRSGMIRFSRETMYNAGTEYCDTSIYTVKAPRNVRRKLGNPSRPCQEALNERNAKLRLKRLIEANFTEGKDIFVTFTFDKGHKPETRAEAVLLLSRAAGSEGMVRGQIMDMFGEQNTLSYEELLTLHARKTGALIRVAAQMGALAAGCAVGSPEMAAAEGYAERIGLAFQVIDDILDATSTPEVLGKSVGGDADHHKNTFLSFHTIPEAEAYAERLTAEAVALLAPYEGAERLTALAEYLAVRKV